MKRNRRPIIYSSIRKKTQKIERTYTKYVISMNQRAFTHVYFQEIFIRITNKQRNTIIVGKNLLNDAEMIN